MEEVEPLQLSERQYEQLLNALLNANTYAKMGRGNAGQPSVCIVLTNVPRRIKLGPPNAGWIFNAWARTESDRSHAPDLAALPPDLA
ncbi:MAG: hypothetical protein M3Z04_02540 [Chloroflexota bacterium]|nr:hypothetical protein [Chloroflexota bacterium]